MAPITFHLISVSDKDAFLEIVRSVPVDAKPQYVGHCEHWIHSPKASLDALTGSGSEMQKWDYLVIANAEGDDPLAIPPYLHDNTTILNHWSITAPADLSTPSDDNARKATPPTLAPGWSPSDYSGLTASIPPSDVEASLALTATPLGASKQDPLQDLKSFISEFGQTHTGPVSVFNIIACNPGKRSSYFDYIAAFRESVGSRYGGGAQFFAPGVTDWSSRVAEGAEVADPNANGSGVWEDFALVWYPSIWHFGKMLDDPDYAEADRKFKVGVIHDNPILCCTEVAF
ncbi:hypothetical protein MBLNU13_g03332t1 [Cladosporium sp. NU13]